LFDPLTGKKMADLDTIKVYANSHYVTPRPTLDQALKGIREELRLGLPPQQAIAAGYERAWATILDSNVTTLIAGGALLIFGSGPVRGFAVVHCLGILTSMFSAILVSRAMVNLVYGRQKKLQKVAIGTVWKPGLANQ